MAPIRSIAICQAKIYLDWCERRHRFNGDITADQSTQRFCSAWYFSYASSSCACWIKGRNDSTSHDSFQLTQDYRSNSHCNCNTLPSQFNSIASL
eukprot:scaffold115_cov123-Cylindrotheca_fusiformis.AAC.7